MTPSRSAGESGWFVEFLLSVSVPKQVSFRSRSLVCLQYGSLLVVLVYIFVYSIGINHSYATRQPANVLAQAYSIHNQTSYLSRFPPAPTYYCYNSSYDWPPPSPTGREVSFAAFSSVEATVVTYEQWWNETSGASFARFVQRAEDIPINILYSVTTEGHTYLAVPLTLYYANGSVARVLQPGQGLLGTTISQWLAYAGLQSLDAPHPDAGHQGDGRQEPFYRLTGVNLMVRFSCTNMLPFQFTPDSISCTARVQPITGTWGHIQNRMVDTPTAIDNILRVERFGVRLLFISEGELGYASVGAVVALLIQSVVLLQARTLLIVVVAQFVLRGERRVVFNRARVEEADLARDRYAMVGPERGENLLAVPFVLR